MTILLSNPKVRKIFGLYDFQCHLSKHLIVPIVLTKFLQHLGLLQDFSCSLEFMQDIERGEIMFSSFRTHGKEKYCIPVPQASL